MNPMLGTILEFAQGTTTDCERLVEKLFTAEDVISAYKHARAIFNTEDLVLVVSERDPSGFQAMPRHKCAEYFRELNGRKALPAIYDRIVHESAHKVAKLPFTSDAMWLVVVRGPQDLPVMCVLFAVAIKTEAVA
jgi:hypothetical protein